MRSRLIVGDAEFWILPAAESRTRRLLSPIAPLGKFWMTYRYPWQRYATVTYPPALRDADARLRVETLAHEAVHVRQLQPWWAPFWYVLLLFVLPFPVLFSGRWLIERDAYLVSIQKGAFSIDAAVDSLWRGYLMPWPKPLMRAWFYRKLGWKPPA